MDRRQALLRTGRAMLGAIVLGGLAGCDGDAAPTGGTEGSAGTPKRGGTLRLGALGKRSAIERDPHGVTANDSDLFVDSLVFEALTIPGAGRTAPRLMSRWEPSRDLTRWNFTIADGATFHDGRSVTADDVVWSLKRLRRTDEGPSRMPGVSERGIRKDSPRSVTLTSETPNAELPLQLRLQTFVLPEGTRDPAKAPGSGPFWLASYRDGNAVLARYDDWHGGDVHLDEIRITMFEDAGALANAAFGGQIDLASNVGPVAARLAKGRPGVRVVTRNNDAAIPIVMRVADGPFADPRVREAIRLAVDRPALVEGALNGFGSVANDVLGVEDPAYAADLPQRTRDTDKAKALLQQARFDTRRTYEIFTAAEVPGQLEAATLFATQMKDVGLRVQVVKQDSAVFYEKTWLKAPLYTAYWGTNDSVGFFVGKTMVSSSAFNETGLRGREVDTLYRKAIGSSERRARRAALRALQGRQYDDGGYVVWGMGDGIDIARDAVRGTPTLPGFGRLFVERAWLRS